jgi:hypothetical protein
MKVQETPEVEICGDNDEREMSFIRNRNVRRE